MSTRTTTDKSILQQANECYRNLCGMGEREHRQEVAMKCQGSVRAYM